MNDAINFKISEFVKAGGGSTQFNAIAAKHIVILAHLNGRPTTSVCVT